MYTGMKKVALDLDMWSSRFAYREDNITMKKLGPLQMV